MKPLTGSEVIQLAEDLSGILVRRAAGRPDALHFEHSDMVDAGILGHYEGRPIKYAILDERRRMGGNRAGRSTFQALNQLQANTDRVVPTPKYIARLALKRCGVLMLDILPQRLRRVMLLRYWHELTQKEVSLELGVTAGRVSQIETQSCAILARELRRRGIRSLMDVI